jgi:TonB-dependent receptor
VEKAIFVNQCRTKEQNREMNMLHIANEFAGKTVSLLGVFFFLTAQSLMAAGSGTIKGKVFDQQTKEELPGANVVVKGTSIGASTDLDGAYTIPNAPGGEQTLVVSYIGYRTATVVVTIASDGTTKQDFYLEGLAIQGKEVVVTAQGQGQIQAINQQLASNKIENVVSDAKIQELPDFNAAQAISRLPGISVTMSSGEANKVVIRGLAPQYNEVAVGGITLASTGSSQIGATSLGLTSGALNDDRSVDLTMVTPYMIKSIEVYKTLTPDLEANAIGGYVNMDLREAPSGVHGDLLWQSGYTQKSNTYGNYRAVASVSDRFIDDLLGVYILGDAEQYDRSSDNMNASYVTASSTPDPDGWRPVRVTGVTLNRHVETRERYGGNVILDFKLPSGSIKATNLFSRLNSDANNYNEVLNYGSTNYDIDFQYQEQNTTSDLAVNSLELTNDFGFMSVDIEAANNYSRNHLPLSPYYTFFQNNGISHRHSVTADTNIAPQNLTHFVDYDAAGDTTVLDATSLFGSDYHENDQVYKGDFKIPLNIGSSVSGFFKFGGQYRYNYHTNAQSTPYIQLKQSVTPGDNTAGALAMDSILALYPTLAVSAGHLLDGSNFTSTNSKLTSAFLSNQFGGMYWAADPGFLNQIVNYVRSNQIFYGLNQNSGGWFDGPYQELPNSYKFIERYYAAYLMSELDLGPDFMVVGGARYEQDKDLYFVHNMEDERNSSAQPVFDSTAYPQNHYWLPMVQAKYDVADWADVRYSYTQTLARPDYTQLSPHFTISSDAASVWAGNPSLNPAQAYNHDLELTIHSNDIGLLSVGGFYKEVNHFTYATSYHLHANLPAGVTGLDTLHNFYPIQPHDDATLYTYINSPYKAYVRGVEGDFETRFWYLPGFLSGIVLGINYTHISSHATYPYYDEVPLSKGKTKFIDSTRTGRLIDQPNDIANTYIGYDYRGFSARLSFVFQGNSVTYVGAYPEQDGFSQNYFRIDFSARQELPLNGLELYLDTNNLNSESNISVEDAIGGFTSEQYYGLTADLGIRYTM